MNGEYEKMVVALKGLLAERNLEVESAMMKAADSIGKAKDGNMLRIKFAKRRLEEAEKIMQEQEYRMSRLRIEIATIRTSLKVL